MGHACQAYIEASVSVFSDDSYCFLCIVDAAYEGMMKRTFLAMALMITAQLPFLIIFFFMYHKLAPPSAKLVSGILDNTSDESDSSEDSEE